MGLHLGPECFMEPLIVNFLLEFPAAWRQKALEGSVWGSGVAWEHSDLYSIASCLCILSARLQASLLCQHDSVYSSLFINTYAARLPGARLWAQGCAHKLRHEPSDDILDPSEFVKCSL